MREKLMLSFDRNFTDIVSRFKDGEVGLVPTDTLYGICARMDDDNAVERVFDIKQRERHKPFLVLADSLLQITPYLKPIPEKTISTVLERYWPGPLTVILPCRIERIPEVVRAGGDTLAVRIPNNPLLLHMIAAVGVPLIAPSANKSGETPPSRIDEVDPQIAGAVDFIVEGECTMKTASTIIDCSVEPYRIVRIGAVDIQL